MNIATPTAPTPAVVSSPAEITAAAPASAPTTTKASAADQAANTSTPALNVPAPAPADHNIPAPSDVKTVAEPNDAAKVAEANAAESKNAADKAVDITAKVQNIVKEAVSATEKQSEQIEKEMYAKTQTLLAYRAGIEDMAAKKRDLEAKQASLGKPETLDPQLDEAKAQFDSLVVSLTPAAGSKPPTH